MLALPFQIYFTDTQVSPYRMEDGKKEVPEVPSFLVAQKLDGKWNRYRPIAFTISPRLHHCKPEYTVAIATPNPQPWVGDAINFSRVSEIIPVYERWPKVLLLTVPLFGVS